MMFGNLFSLVAIPSLSIFSSVQSYSLTWELKGDDFLNEFDYWDSGLSADPTGTSEYPSAAYYMPKSAAQNQGLVYVNDEGTFHLGVDSTFAYQNSNLRPSVRISSRKTIYEGLLIIDALHLAYGTTSWPSIWMTSTTKTWPSGGEIDIYEGVSTDSQNTMSYHTSSGCYYDTNAKQTGKLSSVGTNCDALSNGDRACGNHDPSTNSFGQGANMGGGSVYAVEWTDSAIKMWHFNRANVPQDITNGKPNPAGWGTPVTNLASTYCNFKQFFAPQTLIINIDICGTWAGAVFPGGPNACFEYAQAHPESFDLAYFEIAYVRYYQ